MSRIFTALEMHLIKLGFSEIYGIGLWAKESNGTVVDTNSGCGKVMPHINASYDNFVGLVSTPSEVDLAISP